MGNDEAILEVHRLLELLDPINQAKTEIALENFNKRVEEAKAKLQQPTLWDRVFPWSIKLIRKNND